ncbi:hypothetical protein K488DRAFT_64966, partial [Vararia minispora EC-137]
IEHISSHLLHDQKNVGTSSQELCGFCLRPSYQCKIYLKGKGTRIDRDHPGCLRGVSFKYSIARESTASLPCSNAPIVCPLCKETDPAVWRYNLKVHIVRSHPGVSPDEYRQLWELKKLKRDHMTQVWKAQHKRPATRKRKGKSRARDTAVQLSVLHAHASTQAIRYVPLNGVERC